MNTILVTGGYGFIGSNFIRFLLRETRDYNILNLDALTYAGNPGNLLDLQDDPRLEFVHGDIGDTALLQRLFKERKIEGVIHFAAESHVDRSIAAPDVFITTNVQGTQKLLAAALDAGVRRFLQISTDEVYGALGADGLFTEHTPLQPNSPYSASKAAADLLVRAYHQTYGMNTVITRCSNNYGPYQFPEKIIPLMFHNATRNEPLPVYGDGLQVRDWIHVDDHCRGIWAAFQHGQAGRVYNLGGNSERTNLQVIREILKFLGKPESLISFVRDRPGHDRRYAIDASRAATELNWQPQISFEVGLRRTLEWYRENHQWVNAVTTGEYRQYYRKLYADRGSA